MVDLILDAIGTLLEGITTGRPARQRVKRALRLSRQHPLSTKHREFAVAWLTFGLENLTGLRLGSREQELRAALERVSQDR